MSVAKVATTHIEHADVGALPNAIHNLEGAMARGLNLTALDRSAFAVSAENRRQQS